MTDFSPGMYWIGNQISIPGLDNPIVIPISPGIYATNFPSEYGESCEKITIKNICALQKVINYSDELESESDAGLGIVLIFNNSWAMGTKNNSIYFGDLELTKE